MKNKNNLATLSIKTKCDGFINITNLLDEKLSSIISEERINGEGVLHIFIMHTSCALTISEAYDPTAKNDLENFFDHLAPRNLKFITHTLEGSDDSPSHMKSALLHQSLTTIVSEGKILLGRWQGIYLCEFRDNGSLREIVLKYIPDNR
ncbi:MAG: YjbQ family protein [Oligoflexia bacterium]|nr:YjbQ family protein [Oligoflexia bacterium]